VKKRTFNIIFEIQRKRKYLRRPKNGSDKLIKILKIIISDFNNKSNSSKFKNKKWLKT
jgi:hypothetical protein